MTVSAAFIRPLPHHDVRDVPSLAGAPLNIPHLLGPEAWGRLHPTVQCRFLPGHGETPITYRGSLDVSRSLIGMAFAAGAILLGGPLPLWRGSDAAAQVDVWQDRDGGVIWQRRLCKPDGRGETVIRSTKRLDMRDGLLECIDGGLGMVLRIFEEDGGLIFESQRYFLDLGFARIPIPALLTPGICRVSHIPVGAHRFRFEMRMVHPLYGETFHQAGEFDDPIDPTAIPAKEAV